jgi:hypothetical protein
MTSLEAFSGKLESIFMEAVTIFSSLYLRTYEVNNIKTLGGYIKIYM